MSAKFCPKCGNQLKEGAKFCPKCGTQIVQNLQSDGVNTNIASNQNVALNFNGPQNTNAMQSQNAEQAKNYAKSFFNWFFESIKHPSLTTKASNQYFGLISFGASIIILLLSTLLMASKLNDALDNVSNGLFGGNEGYDIIEKLVEYGTVKIAAFSILMIVIFVGLGFGFRLFAVAGTGEKTDFFEYVNKLAAYTNISVLLSAVMFIFLLVGGLVGLSFNFFIFIFVLINDLTAYTYSIVNGDKSNKFDKLYVVLLAHLALIIVFFMLFYKVLTV